MYKCYNPKHFFELLFIDAIVFILCAVFFCVGKAVLKSSADNSSEPPVFLPVIMYHSICERNPNEYIVTPQQAESDLTWLKEHGYTSVSAQQLIKYTHGKGSLPDKPVLITLDDGFYNNLSEFLPLLEKYDMNAIISVVGKYTNDNASADPHIPSYSYLTWNDISELLDSNRIEIGNHTYDLHSIKTERNGCAKLPHETNQEYVDLFTADIGRLQSEMIQNTEFEPIVFAYPFGSISAESLPILKDFGIMMTLTCYEKPNYITREPDCLFGINRYNRSGFYSTEEFMQKITSE
ncbi:MAG: polysaccharide deacetylase family protein [Ruminococcus sp.]|nr:polysaccharide deacetylase family protein [Ruminococcus sp.]